MEYSVYDAVRAGFHKIVFIIKTGMEPTIRALRGPDRDHAHPQGEPVEVAMRCRTSPAFRPSIPFPGAEEAFRHGPRGLCARDVVQEPFCYYQRRRLLRRLGL